MIEVHTYSKPAEWQRHALWNDFSDAVHICATNNQRLGIGSRYGKQLNHIYSFREFIKELYPAWYSAETKIQQYLRLSKLITGLSSVHHEIRQAFRKNALELLESIRFFVEAGVYPDVLEHAGMDTDKEKLFMRIWQQFLQEDEPTKAHYRALQRPLTVKKVWDAIFELNEQSDVHQKSAVPQKLHIVLHGFYFVTPEQQVVFELLRGLPIRMTFFHYYDGRYADTFDFIKAFVTDRFGWPSPDEWKYDQLPYNEPTASADAFLASYEQKAAKPFTLNDTITAYSSFFDFLHDVILPNFHVMKQNDVRVIAPNAEELNDLLTAYYPELNTKKRNFLSYPIGRFFVSLHQIYNDGRLELSESILTDLFASGWIFDCAQQVNAQDYLHDLQQLFPYLQGCTGVNEWVARLDQLIAQGLTIEQAFPAYREDRIIRSMRSPFARIGHFAVPLHCVKQIKLFFESIRRIAESTFGDSDTDSINSHFKKLNKILKTNGRAAALNAEEAEKGVIRELEERLDRIDDDSEFMYSDLQTALQYYLGGRLDRKDQDFISSFLEIDGEMFKAAEQPVYLTGLDEHALPLRAASMPYPLQPETFDRLCEYQLSLQLHAIRNRAGKSISRYLFFIALNLSPNRLKLSWIKNVMDEHELQPALYIKQLGLKVVEFSPSARAEVSTYQPHVFVEDSVEGREAEEIWKTLAFEDFLVEYNLCPQRFYYSYITEEYPVFSNDFMHQFLFSEVVKLAAVGSQRGFKAVYKEVSPLFPQWLDYKKRVAAKTAYKYRPRNPGTMNEVDSAVSYTEIRKNYQFPGFKKSDKERLVADSKRNMEETIAALMSQEVQSLPANPGYACRFCPHIDYCADAIHAVDLRREGDT